MVQRVLVNSGIMARTDKPNLACLIVEKLEDRNSLELRSQGSFEELRLEILSTPSTTSVRRPEPVVGFGELRKCLHGGHIDVWSRHDANHHESDSSQGVGLQG